jgi:hypothetical protein
MSDTFSCLDVCNALMQRASNSKLSWIWISGLICPPFSYPFLIGILNHRGLFWFGQVFGAEIIEITYGHSLSKTHTACHLHTVSLTGDDLTWWFDRKICRDIFHFTESALDQKNSLNDKISKLLFAIWRKNCSRRFSSGRTNLQIDLEAKFMDGSSWIKIYIILIFTLFYAGFVLFTVNGLL